MSSRIMYIELKTHGGGHDDRRPARIGRATFSRTGRTIYYAGKRLQRMPDQAGKARRRREPERVSVATRAGR